MSVFEGKRDVAEYVYDFAVDGGSTATYTLSGKSGFDPIPVGAVITDVTLYVETAVTSGGSLTLDVGNGDDADGYMAAIAVAALTADSVHRTGSVAGALLWDDTNDHPLGVYVADAADGAVSVTVAAAAATAGKVRVFVDYYAPKSKP